jgi:flagellar basal-body rod protein FlgF
LPVMGNGGPIILPPAANVEIGADGVVSVLPLGGGAVGLAEVDRIKLVKPDSANLEKKEDGLMHLKEEGGVVPPDGTVRVEAGFLEGSNVNAVSSLTDILSLSRQYELQVKLMSQADQISQQTARLLQFS